MKSDHWFSRNRLLSQLRIASGVTLISAAAAMAFVAATDNDLTIGNCSRKARPLPAFGGKLTAQDLAGNGGEPAISESDQDGLDRAAQEAYRHRAYPATEVRIADTLNAQKAWAKIKGKSAKAGVNAQGQWSLAGPSIASYPGSLTFTATTISRLAARRHWQLRQIARKRNAVSIWVPPAEASGGRTTVLRRRPI